ncbi:MAG: helix-turn-helix domain-containing protein [Candidatus Competibacteraceae bacterium]
MYGKAGIVKDIADLAGLLGRSESTIRLWFARYQAEGLSGLLAWNYRGGKRPALSEAVLEALRIRLQEPDSFGVMARFGIGYRTNKVWKFRIKRCIKRFVIN